MHNEVLLIRQLSSRDLLAQRWPQAFGPALMSNPAAQ